jgi:hypothetical protein
MSLTPTLFPYSFFKTKVPFFFLIPFLLLTACQEKNEKNIHSSIAFYHWKTNFQLNNIEKNYLEQLQVQKIYLKFFDVDWDFHKESPKALASLEMNTHLETNFEIIPTIFITNRTLVHLPKKQLLTLANQISKKLHRQLQDFSNQKIKEIQFDCDWTLSTKEKYFQLLKILKQELTLLNIQLSATIRLHQIKFANKTGIPPVYRGTLMYYNMGEVQDWASENSILDNEIGQKYLANLNQYPLALDVALPLFQWGVLFRNNQMIKLINQLTLKDLADKTKFVKIEKNRWKVIKSGYLKGYYLYEDDLIRLETVQQENLQQAAVLLQKQLKKEQRSFIFYHLDTAIIQQFETAKLQQVLSIPS